MCPRARPLRGGSGGRYESGQDIKGNLVFGSGEYKSSCWASSPPRLRGLLQACGQLGAVAQETSQLGTGRVRKLGLSFSTCAAAGQTMEVCFQE